MLIRIWFNSLLTLLSVASANAMNSNGGEAPSYLDAENQNEQFLAMLPDDDCIWNGVTSATVIGVRCLAMMGSSFSWCLSSCLPESTEAVPPIFRDATHQHWQAITQECESPIWQNSQELVCLALPCAAIPTLDILIRSNIR